MTTKSVMAVAIIVMAAVGSVKANDSDSEKSLKIIPNENSETYKLIYERDQAEPVLVSIKDFDGNLLVSQRIARTSRFIIPLNLSEVESGMYNVEIKTKSGVIEESFQHTSMSDHLRDRLYLQTKGAQVALVGHDLGESQLDLHIYNDSFDSIYNEKVFTNDVVEKQFNLQALDTEVAMVVVYHDSEIVLEAELEIS